MKGDGSLNNPWNLATALSAGSVPAGRTLYLRGGTYQGNYNCTLNGTAEAPILIKPYPGERVVLDGDLTIAGSYTHWYDIEKTQTGVARWSDEEGSNPVSLTKGNITATGVGIKLINWIVYDQVSDGIGFWQAASGAELYGCLMFNNGWLSTDRGHGHSIYTQNAVANAAKSIKHCILAQEFGANFSNLALYGAAGQLAHYVIDGIVVISGKMLLGGGEPLTDILVKNSHMYGDLLQFGYADIENNEFTLQDSIAVNTEANPFRMMYVKTANVSNCTLANLETSAPPAGYDYVSYTYDRSAGYMAFTGTGNAYHYTGAEAKPFAYGNPDAVGVKTFAEWQTLTGSDADSTYSTDAPADSVTVIPNEYDTNKAIIVIWNHTLANSVNVDLTGFLAADDTYRLRSAINYFGDVATGTVGAGDVIAVDMQAVSHDVAIPRDWETALIDTTFPRFGCFVIEKT